MGTLKKFFKNKKIIITGHTGFKGSWLTAWLVKMGAKVTGLSLSINTTPSHFLSLNLKKKIDHNLCDIRNKEKIKHIIKKKKPDFIFHLAAQAIVTESYKNPRLTFETNTLATLNILESLKYVRKKCIVVIITSDKVYKNFEIKRGYSENDILGGHDPYSASKAAAELIIESYIKSFYSKNKKLKIGIARAGNVLGGGDWSPNRLIPDCVKSWSKNRSVLIRNPSSTRPWQHVLEAIHGYLVLAIKLKNKNNLNGQAFNFGPSSKNVRKVSEVIKLMKKNWKKVKFKINSEKSVYYESKLLKLNSNKALRKLNWKCILSFEETISMVTNWYKNFYSKSKKKVNLTSIQIAQFEELIKKKR